MQEMQLRDAKAQFSSVIDAAAKGEPTLVTRHGKPTAVVVSYEEWQRSKTGPSFVDMLLSCPIQEEDLHLFERDQTPPREFEF